MTAATQNTLRKKTLPASTKMFVVAVIALLYCPFFNMMRIGEGYVGDTIIQIRVGLDMIRTHGFILNEIYSWHEGLSWVPHEVGWYFISGAAYKLFGIAGVIGLSAIFNYTMAGIIFKENLKKVNPYMIVLACAIARFLSFPNYNARPHLVSQLLFVILVFSMLGEKLNVYKKGALYVGLSFLMAWSK